MCSKTKTPLSVLKGVFYVLRVYGIFILKHYILFNGFVNCVVNC